MCCGGRPAGLQKVSHQPEPLGHHPFGLQLLQISPCRSQLVTLELWPVRIEEPIVLAHQRDIR